MLQTISLLPRTERCPSVRSMRNLLTQLERSADALPPCEQPRLLACAHHMIKLLRLAADPRTTATQRVELRRGAFVELRRLEMRLVQLGALPAFGPLERALDRADMIVGALPGICLE